MKKFFAIILAMAFALTTFACNKGKPKKPEPVKNCQNELLYKALIKKYTALYAKLPKPKKVKKAKDVKKAKEVKKVKKVNKAKVAKKPVCYHWGGCFNNQKCRGQAFADIDSEDCQGTLKKLKRPGSWTRCSGGNYDCYSLESDGSYTHKGKRGCFANPNCDGEPLFSHYYFSNCKVVLKRLKISGSYRDVQGLKCRNLPLQLSIRSLLKKHKKHK